MLDKDQLNQLYRYSLSLTDHADDAYDLLHTALEKYLTKQNGMNESVSLPYIRRIIRNQYIDQWRRDKKILFESLDGQEHATAIDTVALDQMIINESVLHTMWNHLDSGEREILFFWAVEGYTAKEIGEELNMPRGTVLSKIYRLKRKISQFHDGALLNQYGGDQ